MIKDGVYNWDFEKGLQRVKAGCVDLIFTDPPYIAEQWEHAYTLLGEGALKTLKPGGFCITYCPQYRLDSVMDVMRSAGLLYYWIIPQLEESNTTVLVHQRNAICLHKPILVFSKPPMVKAPRVFCDVVRGKKQKAYHAWQQSIHEALGIISRFGDPGQLLFDPFTGSGTSLLAAKLLGMRYLGFERDKQTYKTALGRLEQRPLDLSAFTVEEVTA